MTKPTERPECPERSDWAQSDQSSLCVEWVAKDQRILHADSKDSDLTGHTHHFVGFVMQQLNFVSFTILILSLYNFTILILDSTIIILPL